MSRAPDNGSENLSAKLRNLLCPSLLPKNKKSMEKNKVAIEVDKKESPAILAPKPIPILLSERAAPMSKISFRKSDEPQREGKSAVFVCREQRTVSSVEFFCSSALHSV